MSCFPSWNEAPYGQHAAKETWSHSTIRSILSNADARQNREKAKSRLKDICTVLEALANHPMTFDDQLVRQILECVVVESKEQIKVIFTGGLEVTEQIG